MRKSGKGDDHKPSVGVVVDPNVDHKVSRISVERSGRDGGIPGMLRMSVFPGEDLTHDGLVTGHGDIVELVGDGRILACCGSIGSGSEKASYLI